MSLNGFLNIHKSSGLTSFDVVRHLKKITGETRIGHGGTLDPLATGVLLIAFGKMTRLLEYVLKQDKKYLTTLELGKRSTTYDADGEIEEVSVDMPPSPEKIRHALEKFVGTLAQVPPAYSAIKVQGKKAYELARHHIPVNLPSRTIQIYSIQLLDYDFPFLKIAVHCSSGTYIRSLANDLGVHLETGAIVSELMRSQIGTSLTIEESASLAELTLENIPDYLLPLKIIAELLRFTVYRLSVSDVIAFTRGERIIKPDLQEKQSLLCVDAEQRVLGVARTDPSGSFLQPEKVLV